MSVLDVLQDCQRNGIKLTVRDGKLLADTAGGTLTPELRARLAEHKPAIIAWLVESSVTQSAITAQPARDSYPLSFAQQQLWLSDQVQGGSAEYNMPAAFELTGALDLAAMQAALDLIARRHSVLRTVFRVENGEPVQIVMPEASVPVTHVNLDDIDADQQKLAVQRMLRDESTRPFDLAHDPMLRCTLVRLAEDRHVVLFTMHHIACDGWSMSVLVKEFIAGYEGRAAELPALPIQYRDYAIWQRESAQGGVLAADVAYWQQRLAGIPVVHNLPLDKPRPAVQGYAAELHQYRIGKPLLDDLKQLGSAHQASLFMVLQSAFALLLSRYSGESDVVIGVPNGGRAHRELEPLIGYFINTQVLRTEIDEQQTVSDLLRQARTNTLDAFAHNNVPFDHLVDVLKHPRSQAHNPLAQIKFVLQNYESGELQLSGLQLKNAGRAEEKVRFDLDLTVGETPDELRLTWAFKSDLFERASIARMAETYHRLLEQLAANPEAKLETLTGLTDDDARALRGAGTGPIAIEGRDVLLPEAMARQAAITPDAVALRVGELTLTYAELETRTNRLAHLLAEQGIERGSRVGVHLGRSIELLIAQIAVMKTGAAYVPLHPAQAGERLAAMVRDAEISVVLLDSRTMRLPVLGVDTVFVDDAATDAGWLSDYPETALGAGVRAEDTIYVLYTSGSTGEPKGVEVHHGGVADYCAFARNNYYGAQLTGSLVATSPAFDLTLPSLYVPLLAGGCVELLPEENELEALSAKLAKDDGAVLLRLTPSHLQALLSLSDDAPRSSAHVFVIGGEVFEPAVARRLQAKFPSARIYNHYGPTETVVGCAWFDVTANLDALGTRIPIGGPMENQVLAVLDAKGRVLPAGIAGELYIGGAGVAKGYLNRADLTAEKFVEALGMRMYRSGDKVRWDANGNLQFLGRIDRQIKLRGFRIELGEIESRLKGIVRDAVVRLYDDQLVAYVVGDAAQQDAVHAQLAAQLPAYMLPGAYVWLAALPLTVNGKVDLHALPAPESSALRTREYEAPQNELEASLAELWQSLLRVEKVGRNDNFFELGGHSLLAVQLVSRLRAELNVELSLRALFSAPTLSALAEVVRSAGATTMDRIVPADRNSRLPLSLAQQRLWFLDQLDKSASAAYHIPAALRLHGDLDVDALQRTLDRLIARHESLRTTFIEIDGVPYQRIAPADCGFALTREDCTEHDIERITNHESQIPFDLANGPLIRGRLLRIADDDHVLLLTQHHIVSDGWSLGILVREVAALYTAFRRGDADPLPPLEIQYADYAQWQRSWLQGEELTRQIGFWKEHLSGAPELLDLPLDRPRPSVQSHDGDRVPLVLSRELTAELRALSQRHGTTMFMTLLSAWGVLLSRLSGQQDVVIGTPVANRQRAEVEKLIGFFVNTLAVRLRFDETPTVRELLAQVKETTLAAFAHQELPFEQIVEAVQPVRSMSHSPLFQTLVALNNTASTGEGVSELPGLTLSSVAREQNTTQFDLALLLADTDERIEAALGFATALFDRETIERWAGHYVRLLEAMVADDATRVDALPMLSDAQRTELLRAETTAYPQDKLIHQSFEEQADAHPDAIAVVFNDQSLTYRELDARANGVAHELIARGVKADDRVAISVERSLEMIVGLLGILKSGSAYVPLDPAYPEDRLRYIVEDSAPVAVLTRDDLTRIQPSDERPNANVAPENLAYIIYTSGSTGMPKGVMVEHRNVARLFTATDAWFHFDANDVWTMFHSYAFDFSVWEIWGALLYGGKLVVVPQDITRSPDEFYKLVCSTGTTILNQTPSAFRQFITAQRDSSESHRLRHVIFGGEALEVATLEPWFERNGDQQPQLVNMYGITETTVHVTYRPLDRSDVTRGGSPIGCAIPDLTVYLLDAHREPVPAGVTGELYIGGAGVARGYLNRAELTAERFIDNPFGEGRLYKSGDLGRRLADGSIEFIGRNDAQVKIRGFRIELGEIEARLAQCEGVREAVVIAREDAPGDKRLVAYISRSAAAELPLSYLREQLSRDLPEYMIPSAFVHLDAMPLTTNGKLDRKSLPAPDALSIITRNYEPPQTGLEQTIASIWCDLLRVEKAGRHDNFFELGGHSLLAVQLASRLRAAFDVEVPLRTLFAAPSLAEQAEAVRAAGASTLGRILVADRSQPLPLSLAQQRLWFLDQLDKAASAAYHMPSALRLTGRLDVDALQRTLDRVVARHEVLRTTFVAINGIPHQQIAPESVGFALTREDCTENDIQRITNDESRTPFDLANGPLIRGRLLRIKDDEHVLLVTQHHIITDGWSQGVLTREVAMLYSAFSRGASDPLPPLEIQYADYAQWQRSWLQGEELTRQFDFWKTHLAGAPALLELPTDRPRPATQSYAGGSVPFVIAPELTAKLRALSQRHGVTMFMTMLSAWAVVLARLSGQTHVVIGTPVANRQRREVENLIGFFINTLALRLRLEDKPTVESLLAQVKETTLAAFAHQELPFEQVVEAVQPQRSQSHSPVAQVTFTWNNLGAPDSEALQASELTLAPVNRPHETTQVDAQLLLSDAGDAILGGLVFATALFDRETIERWSGYYVRVLEGMVSASATIDALPLLDDAERNALLYGFNDTTVAYPSDACIHTLFEQRAAEDADKVALVYEDESVTYGELNERANQLAHYLIHLGVQPDDRVAICTERNTDLIVGLLAILKAGGAYLPLDPAYPQERLTWMLADAQPVAMLIHSDIAELLPETDIPTLRLDVDVPVLTRRLSTHNPQLPITAENLAYVIYTSGSTGTPKGVMVQHRNVNRLVINNPYFAATADDCFAHCANPAFDAATWEIWGALLNGARLLVVPSSVVMEPSRLNATLATNDVTALWLTVGLFNQYVDHLGDAFAKLRYLLVGGDALDPRTIRTLLSREQRPQHIVNGYGPTETTTFAITHDIVSVADDARSIPLGKPIGNTQIYILDANRELVPLGAAGEIYIGGDGVARGYLNRPELTTERFVETTFGRLYKTGDRGRWLRDGTIEFLGRNDFQVKLRGFRIELGEIEARLAECEGVRDVIVIAREDHPGDKRLVAYVTGDNIGDLRATLATQLPEYMIPSAFVQLDAFPLTANGKVDRKALPAPEATALSTHEYEAPQGDIEETLANLWQELLHVERVGRNDQFFELGGHSLLVVAMVERLRALGLSGEVRAVFAAPTLREYAATLQRDDAPQNAEVPANLLTPDTEHITPELLPLVTLTQPEIDRIVALVPGGAANIQDVYPLLPLQEGMLFHHLLETEGDTYLLRDLIAFDSRERLARFLDVLQQVIARHDILRTAVAWEGLSNPVQVVFRDAPLPVHELTLANDRDAVDQLRERTDPHHLRLDLRRAPLLAAYIAEDAARGEWLLSLLSHHMVCDHSTMELVVSEVRALLRDASAQLARPFPLRNLVAQAGRVAPSEHEAYFREQLGDIDEPTAPFGILDVQVKTTDLRNSGVRLDPALADRIRESAGALGVPPSVLFHVAWAQVLARCTGREDVVFGTVLSGRLQGAAGADRALGMFINTLPLRLSVNGNARAVIQQSYERMVSLLAHEQAPLVLAQRCSAVSMPLPLFTTLLNYRHSVDATIPVATQEMEGLRRLSVHEAANYPLSVSVDDYGTTFAISAECTRAIDPKRLVAYVLTAVTNIVDALTNDAPLASADILPVAERTQLLHDCNATATPYPSDKLIHQLFEERAAAQPDAPAVICGDASLTYGELNARANQLAHELIARGVQADDRVALHATRSLDTMIALLGILKSGAAYLAIDPSSPAERIQQMLADAAPKVVVTDVLFPNNPTHNPQPTTTSRSLAYVIYTSGSTGTPKGVMVEHRSVVNMLTAQAAMCALTASDRVLQFASFAFDSSVAEIFPAWSVGAAVVLRPADGALDDFASFLDRHGITVVDIPTALWRQGSQQLLSSCRSLRLVIVSGETMESRDVEQWFTHPRSAEVTLLNNYGPTEATVNATAHVVVPAPVIPIGRPIANTQIYILGATRELVPLGVEGEIYIGGDGVARGYLHRPELTAERFVETVFGRLYKTGDVGRWLPDGTIEFRGRNDFQVKIRGFRIELGEIEAKLAQCEGVREAVVIAREDIPGDKRLVAYISRSAAAEQPLSYLREQLSRDLPEYMIPSAFVALEALPLTRNGKLDRKALPAPDALAFAAREYEAPEGEIESTLAAIWQDLLGVPQVGRNDHFFELGGHSLRAITLTVRVQEQLHVELPLKTIFTAPRLADLAQWIAEKQQSLISDEQVAAMQSELDSLSDEELMAFLGGNGLG